MRGGRGGGGMLNGAKRKGSGVAEKMPRKKLIEGGKKSPGHSSYGEN